MDLKDCSSKTNETSEKIVAFEMNKFLDATIDGGSGLLNLNIAKDDETVLKGSFTKENNPRDIVSAELSPANGVDEQHVANRMPLERTMGAEIKVLDTSCCDSSGSSIFLSILHHGSKEISLNPRDSCAHWCLYALISKKLKRRKHGTVPLLKGAKEDLLFEFARKCLLRCLTISNQVESSGIFGMFKHGSSESINGESFIVLQELANDFAYHEQWADADCVCRAVVVRCEENLHLHHPTTFSSLFDLAITSSMIGNQSFADRILRRAAERLSKYLLHVESLYMSHLSKAKQGGKPGETIFRIEPGRDAIFALHAFASLFRKQLSRDMVRLVGTENEIVLANHCFVADTLSVLANCIAAANFFGGSAQITEFDGLQYWSIAYMHYELCYTIAAKKGLDDVSVSRSVFGMARCLREFGEAEKALKLLSFTVAFKGEEVQARVEEKSNAEDTTNSEQQNELLPRFLPAATLCTLRDNQRISRLLSRSLCLWLMAILSVDDNRNDEGRERAFGYLHAASISLQTALQNVSDIDDDALKTACIRFLSMIEDEAEQISEQMYE
jgi:Tetratrico peptide repeat